MTSYKTSLSKRHITMHSDNVHHIEFKISKNTVMHVSTCEIMFVKYMKAPNNEIKYCTLKQTKIKKKKKTILKPKPKQTFVKL